MKVSVCIAVYNGEKFLKETLNSILQQLNNDDEIIIIDDASTDHSLKIIQSFNDQRIRISNNTKNKGVNISFYNALKKAEGDLIFIADQDDTWRNNKVSIIKKEFQKERRDIIIHDAFIIEDGIQKKESLFQVNKSGTGFFKNLWSDKYVGCCMVISKEGLKKILPSKINPKVYYDHFLGLMAEIKKLNVLFLGIQLIHYNRHQNNQTDIRKRRKIGMIIMDRARLIKMLLTNLF